MKTIESISYGSTFSFLIDESNNGVRLDKYLALQFPAYSRSFLQKAITQGWVQLNEKPTIKGGATLKTDDRITVQFPSAPDEQQQTQACAQLGIELVFEHPHFLIINKPAGVLVHKPNHYSTAPTVVDWVLSHYQEVAQVGTIDRPGIVHRIDKETSGLLIIPRTNYAHGIFGQMFKDRLMKKTYYAVVQGSPDREGTIDYAVGRHPHARTKMHHFDKELVHRTGNESLRSAVTHFKVLTYYENAALVEAKPVTGRTHQIRVHFAALRHPIIGDTVYGSPSKFIGRHALHAHALHFTFNNEPFNFELPLPEDMRQLIANLRPIEKE
jgi:23S rRNA pseudouridine1911/1915/1917 synthase